MAIVNTHYGFCAKGGAAVKFTYTGEYNARDDGVVELMTSGTIVFLEPKVIDVFMVGGGGGGHITSNYLVTGFGGGGGGYTKTIRRVNVAANTGITVTIGPGGAPNKKGGTSAFGNNTVNGGSPGSISSQTDKNGGAGGSGGGGGVKNSTNTGSGGSDGNNGENGYPTANKGGAGQGFTTREFGEVTGKLYAGGGGGGRYTESDSPIVSIGGAGGGGNGAWSGRSNTQAATEGVANTGGGGGGGARHNDDVGTGGSAGGSGIVCFRDAAPLPELAGTWVLNERLYAPESDVYFANQDFTIGNASNPNRATVRNLSCTTAKIEYTTTMGYTFILYTFSNNTWGTNKYTYLTFPAGATASDEFRAWLASNATKQS